MNNLHRHIIEFTRTKSDPVNDPVERMHRQTEREDKIIIAVTIVLTMAGWIVTGLIF